MTAYAKAKVEAGVLVAERWILAALRDRTFFSLAEANGAIRERLAWLNERPFRRLPGSRRSLYLELDRPALRPLPARRFEYAVWTSAKVNIKWCAPGYGESNPHDQPAPLRISLPHAP